MEVLIRLRVARYEKPVTRYPPSAFVHLHITTNPLSTSTVSHEALAVLSVSAVKAHRLPGN